MKNNIVGSWLCFFTIAICAVLIVVTNGAEISSLSNNKKLDQVKNSIRETKADEKSKRANSTTRQLSTIDSYLTNYRRSGLLNGFEDNDEVAKDGKIEATESDSKSGTSSSARSYGQYPNNVAAYRQPYQSPSRLPQPPRPFSAYSTPPRVPYSSTRNYPLTYPPSPRPNAYVNQNINRSPVLYKTNRVYNKQSASYPQYYGTNTSYNKQNYNSNKNTNYNKNNYYNKNTNYNNNYNYNNKYNYPGYHNTQKPFQTYPAYGPQSSVQSNYPLKVRRPRYKYISNANKGPYTISTKPNIVRIGPNKLHPLALPPPNNNRDRIIIQFQDVFNDQVAQPLASNKGPKAILAVPVRKYKIKKLRTVKQGGKILSQQEVPLDWKEIRPLIESKPFDGHLGQSKIVLVQPIKNKILDEDFDLGEEKSNKSDINEKSSQEVDPYTMKAKERDPLLDELDLGDESEKFRDFPSVVQDPSIHSNIKNITTEKQPEEKQQPTTTITKELDIDESSKDSDPVSVDDVITVKQTEEKQQPTTTTKELDIEEPFKGSDLVSVENATTEKRPDGKQQPITTTTPTKDFDKGGSSKVFDPIIIDNSTTDRPPEDRQKPTTITTKDFDNGGSSKVFDPIVIDNSTTDRPPEDRQNPTTITTKEPDINSLSQVSNPTIANDTLTEKQPEGKQQPTTLLTKDPGIDGPSKIFDPAIIDDVTTDKQSEDKQLPTTITTKDFGNGGSSKIFDPIIVDDTLNEKQLEGKLQPPALTTKVLDIDSPSKISDPVIIENPTTDKQAEDKQQPITITTKDFDIDGPSKGLDPLVTDNLTNSNQLEGKLQPTTTTKELDSDELSRGFDPAAFKDATTEEQTGEKQQATPISSKDLDIVDGPEQGVESVVSEVVSLPDGFPNFGKIDIPLNGFGDGNFKIAGNGNQKGTPENISDTQRSDSSPSILQPLTSASLDNNKSPSILPLDKFGDDASEVSGSGNQIGTPENIVNNERIGNFSPILQPTGSADSDNKSRPILPPSGIEGLKIDGKSLPFLPALGFEKLGKDDVKPGDTRKGFRIKGELGLNLPDWLGGGKKIGGTLEFADHLNLGNAIKKPASGLDDQISKGFVNAVDVSKHGDVEATRLGSRLKGLIDGLGKQKDDLLRGVKANEKLNDTSTKV